MKRVIYALALICLPISAQVPVRPIVQPHITFVDQSGAPCSSCKLYSDAAGTTTPLATYTDASGTSQNTNPIVLDTAGGANIWLGTNSYKLILKDASGSTIWTVDQVSSIVFETNGSLNSSQTLVNLIGGANISISNTAGNITISAVGVVSTAPSATQKVVQPSGTSLLVNSLNNVLYVDPTSSTDLITQINALFTACNFACEVHIPAGNYTVASGTILINHATESLTGDGKDKVRITYAGTNFLDWHFNSSTYDFNAAGEVSGFTVTCSNTAAICLSGGSTIGATWKDLNVYGPGGIANASPAGTSQAFVFQNTFNWMERWTMKNVNIGGFATNIHFLAPTGAGTDSFGYGLVNGVWTNQGCGTKGVVVDVGADVYNTLGFNYQFNYACSGVTTGTEIFTVGGNLRGQGFHVTGENASANYTFAHVLTNGNMNLSGDYFIFGPPNTGGVIVDTPQTGTAIPFYIGTEEGTVYKSAGIPLLANYDGSGESFIVTPIEVPSFATNQISARFGYLTSTSTGKTAPYDAFDAAAKFCHFTRNQFQTDASLSPAWCVDGSGNVTNYGSITLGASSAISSMKKYSITITPASVAANTCSEQQFTVAGLTQTEYVTQISNAAALNGNGGITMTARADVFTAGKIDIQFCNVSASAIVPFAGVYIFLAIH